MRTLSTISQDGCVYYSVNGSIIIQVSASNLILLKADHLLKSELVFLAKKIKEVGIIAALDLLFSNREELCHEMEVIETLGQSDPTLELMHKLGIVK